MFIQAPDKKQSSYAGTVLPGAGVGHEKAASSEAIVCDAAGSLIL